MTEQPPMPLPVPSAETTAAVQARLAAVGIPSDDPIVPIVAGLAEMVETTRLYGKAINGSLDRLQQAAAAERAAMKAATEHCRSVTQKLESTFGTMEVRAHNLVTQTIHSMADRVAEQMRDRMVIVERRYNRIALWRRAGVLTAAVTAIFLVGFVAAEYSDRDATNLMDRCLAHPLVNAQTGGLVCDVGSPRSGG